jgi:hypothetical protein
MSDLFSYLERSVRAKAERKAARKRASWSKLTPSAIVTPQPPVKPTDPRRPESHVGSLGGEGIGISAQWGKGKRHSHEKH